MTEDALRLAKSALQNCYDLPTMKKTRRFEFDKDYSWLGEKTVRLVPMFATGSFEAYEDMLLWVYSVEDPDQSYHVPARLLTDID